MKEFIFLILIIIIFSSVFYKTSKPRTEKAKEKVFFIEQKRIGNVEEGEEDDEQQ